MKSQLVLIVEDDEWMASQYERVLKKAGYKTSVCQSAEGAIDAVDKSKPAVIILDVLLSVSTGLTLLHELRSYSDTESLPIVLCSNLAQEIDIEDVAPYGVKRILDKTTMEPSDIVAAVRSVT
jgi:twitching motility two-component system response regulator PilH